MFHPNLGRFLQPDPVGFDSGDENLYRFVGNNPENRLDPSGLQAIKPLGGTQFDLPLGFSVCRLIFNPKDKATCLKGVPFCGKDALPRLPKDLMKKTCGGDTGWAGVLPDGWAVGPDGCGPCVGAVLYPRKPGGGPTFVLHCSAGALAYSSLIKVGFVIRREVIVEKPRGWAQRYCYEPLPGYQAVICGCEAQPKDEAGDLQRLHTLDELTSCLRACDVRISTFVPAPGVCVDNKGNLYWITGDSLNVGGYDK